MRLLGCVLALALSACGVAPVDGDGVGAIVMVSGRDDHGLLQVDPVALSVEPEGAEISAHVPDGSFAEVLEVRGTWLHVRSVGDPAVSGWIDDFHLRDRASIHGVEQYHFLAARLSDGVGVEIQVEPVDGGRSLWVASVHLVEVGAVEGSSDH